MFKRSAAFTLIELMVVVAIIAILSTMGVANFSTAIKRSRNAVRQNDVIAVSKALETCYDVMGAKYFKDGSGSDCNGDYHSRAGSGGSTGVFVADVEGTSPDCKNRCLNANIVPTLTGYDYTAKVGLKDNVQKYIVCAKLEKVGNVEGIGNSKDDLTLTSDIGTAITTLADPNNDCKSDTDCYFCVAAQQ